MKKRKGIRAVVIAASVLMVVAVLFILYVRDCYHASPDVDKYFSLDGAVTITDTECGLLLDGDGTENALIFYPGAGVEYTAYIPLLCEIAENGIDVFLVKMPFNLAFFGINRASGIISSFDYSRWYISGHSLGGAMAAYYAYDNYDKLDGIIFLAAYTTKNLTDKGLRALTVYGSEDGVISFDKLTAGRNFLPEGSEEVVIEGGNHALFGLYGEQNGDGTAAVRAGEQWEMTSDAVTLFMLGE